MQNQDQDIIIGYFVKRQTMQSEFSSFLHDDFREVLRRVKQNWPARQQGYRSGVVLVPIEDTLGFFTSTCLLQEGDQLAGSYRARHPGELPRKATGVVDGQKTPAKRVDIVCYHRDTLAESNENTVLEKRNDFAEWEVVSINASICDGAEPMTPGTLMANHFHTIGSNDGGTSTKMDDATFVAALQESYLYWRDKSKIASQQVQK